MMHDSKPIFCHGTIALAWHRLCHPCLWWSGYSKDPLKAVGRTRSQHAAYTEHSSLTSRKVVPRSLCLCHLCPLFHPFLCHLSFRRLCPCHPFLTRSLYDLNPSIAALNISQLLCHLCLLTVSARCCETMWKGQTTNGCNSIDTCCWSKHVWRQGCLGWCWEIWPVVVQPLLSFPSFPFWPAWQKLSAHHWASGTVQLASRSPARVPSLSLGS